MSSISAVAVSDALNVPVEGLSLGSGWSCAHGGAAAYQCWGNLTYVTSQVHYEPQDFPVTQSFPIVDVGVGLSHTCRLQADGFVRCFGRAKYYELGPASQGDVAQPTPVVALGNVAKLTVGWQHSCALLNDGEVRCWGRNQFGQTAPHVGDAKLATPTRVDLTP